MARLLADIGGTHARFAWQAEPGLAITDHLTLPCARFPNLAEAMAAALSCWQRDAPAECGLAIATAVAGDEVRMTNRGWTFSIDALRRHFGFARLEVLNDFSALARAVPALPADQLVRLGGGAPVAGAPIAVLGPGTGLGVSGLVPDGRGGWHVLASEGGHATLPACTARERELLTRLAEDHGHVSAERALSGPGLVNLHAAVFALARPRAAPPVRSAAAISRAALRARDPVCIEVLQHFCALLGGVAGNLALTLGARGGVYLGGGIVPQVLPLLENSSFRERFEAKGRLADYLAPIPVFAIRSPESPALRGAASALDC